MLCNDLSNQFEYSTESNNEKYEFEPLAYQPNAESILPPEIRELFRNQNEEIQSGILVDNVCYFIKDKILYLWSPGPKSSSQHRFQNRDRDMHQSKYRENLKFSQCAFDNVI